MAHEFKAQRRVEFSDTDMAGIMHYANFFRFMETAEHGFFRSIGYSIHTTGFAEPIGWPRVHADCDFRYPLRFEDVVEVRLLVREKREKSLVYAFTFHKLNEEPVREVARGSLGVACVRRDRATGQMKGIPIPAAIAGQIEAAPKELLV